MPLRLSLHYKGLYCLMVWVMQGVERVQHTGQGTHSRTASDALNYRRKLVPGYISWYQENPISSSYSVPVMCACSVLAARVLQIYKDDIALVQANG